MPFTQQQAIALLSLLSEGKLISELTELLSLDTDNNFVAINSGSNDAKKIKIPLLRGYKGTYNASTNTPSLSNTVGLDGDMYVVSVAGSRDFGAGVVNLLVDDIIIYLNGKYVKTNGIVTGSLDLQGVYDNSSPKTITVADSIDGTLTVKDSSTNNERDEILQVQDTSGNILFYVQRDKTYVEQNLDVGQTVTANLLSVGNEGKVISTSNQGLQLQATSSSKPIIFYTNVGGNIERARITHDGNFGIGTTTPSEKLEVAGNVKVVGHIKLEDHLEIRDQNTAVSDEQNLIGVEFYTSDFSFNPPSPLERATTPIGRILPVAEHPNGDSYGLTFYTSDTDSESVERMRITSQGNLGIGTSTPTEKLEVVGTIKTTNLIATNDVGIGTTTPSEKLDVNGAARISNSLEVGLDLNVLRNAKVDGSLGVGISSSVASEKLEVSGNIKSSGNVILNENSRVKLDVDVDDNSYILHDGTNVYASANDHKFIQGSNDNYAEVHTGNLYEHFTITSLTSSSNLTDASRFLLYNSSSDGTLTIPQVLSANSQEWQIVNASSSNTLTVSVASGVTLDYINNDGNNGVISASKSATLVRYEDDGYYLIKY